VTRVATGSQAGAQRRVRALCARGWAPDAIERAAGIPAGVAIRVLARRDTIRPDACAQVAGAYELLWNRQPPQRTGAEQAAAKAITAHARARGWAPPMAWDDEQLDDPAGRPAEGWRRGRDTTRRSADLAEDAQFVREHGGYRLATSREVAMRLGVTTAALDKAISRAHEAQTAAGREAC
jgi:hypothetical protein